VKYLVYISIALSLTACFEPDEVLPKQTPSEITVRLNTLSNQTTYLNLGNLLSNNIGVQTQWQLKFQNLENAWSIYLNPLAKAGVHNTTNTNFEDINSQYKTNQIIWDVDVPTSSGTYPAVGTWGDYSFSNPKSYQNVYIITWEESGTLYMYKFQMLDATDSAYHIRYGALNDSVGQTKWIVKNKNYSHSYFSLKDNVLFTQLEPSKEEWNICFTYVSDSIKLNPKLAYIPTSNSYFGLFQTLNINQELNETYLDTTASFENIDYFYARDLPYTRIDQLLSPFFRWDFVAQQASTESGTILLVKNREKYFALQPVSVVSQGLESLIFKIKVKQL
jgi:hypothetical protein